MVHLKVYPANRARLRGKGRLFWVFKVLTPHACRAEAQRAKAERPKTDTRTHPALCVQDNLHQRASKAACLVGLMRLILGFCVVHYDDDQNVG
jgi:hypothetical protein